VIALVKYAHGKGNYEFREVPEPEPGDDDVVIQIKAAGLCASDIDFIEGRQAGALRPPVILGHEFSGVIFKAGKNVKKWKEGDRVVSDNTGSVCGECHACSAGDYLGCSRRLGLGYGMDGGFTRYTKIPGDTLRVFPNTLMRIPDGISFEEAAVMDPAGNAYRAVVQEAKIIPGEYTAVFGIGTIGQFALQCARAAGASKIIAIANSPNAERFKLARENGATHTIISSQTSVIEAVYDLTEGEGVAAVIDCAGANVVLKQGIEIIRTGGIFVRVGYDTRPVDMSMDRLLERGVTVKGHFGYDWAAWKNVFNLVLANKFSLSNVISRRMPLKDFDEAVDMLKNRKAVKIILYPQSLSQN
jgi:threonine dehydrogenase-like Zn-dependent dehydrogenase